MELQSRLEGGRQEKNLGSASDFVLEFTAVSR
jgi:hypothetical protein